MVPEHQLHVSSHRLSLTLRLSKSAWAIASLIYVGMNVLSNIMTFRDFASVMKCLLNQLIQEADSLDKSLSQFLQDTHLDYTAAFFPVPASS